MKKCDIVLLVISCVLIVWMVASIGWLAHCYDLIREAENKIKMYQRTIEKECEDCKDYERYLKNFRTNV